MTLIDTAPGFAATLDVLAEELGVTIPSAQLAAALGPPIEEMLAPYVPAEQLATVADRYRALYPDHGVGPTRAMPGAVEAIEAVRRAGGRTIVVTAKHEPNARLHLDHLGIRPDVLVGWLWAEAKAVALREHGASVYVGDHIGDVRGARTAGALSVAVTTGPCDGDALRAEGADVVLAGLTEFPGWLAGHTAERAASRV